MPAAAIATGMVEQVLPVEGIPAALVQLAAERRRHPPESLRGEAEVSGRRWTWSRRTTGHDFSRYKRSTILRRFQRRMAATGVATVREYATLIQSDGDETRRLAEDLTINVTSFFRDDEPFRTLERIVIPDVLERRRTDGIRIWVPGAPPARRRTRSRCCFASSWTERPRPSQLQIFATDIDASVLAEARRGQYPSAVERQVSAERLARFFTKRGRLPPAKCCPWPGNYSPPSATRFIGPAAPFRRPHRTSPTPSPICFPSSIRSGNGA